MPDAATATSPEPEAAPIAITAQPTLSTVRKLAPKPKPLPVAPTIAAPKPKPAPRTPKPSKPKSKPIPVPQTSTNPSLPPPPSPTQPRSDRIALALTHYHNALAAHTHSPSTHPKPIVLQLAKSYHIPESTLRRHIKTPGHRSTAEANRQKQLFTPEEEEALVRALQDPAVPADRSRCYELAHEMLHRRVPGRTVGRDWFYRFLRRHPECGYSSGREGEGKAKGRKKKEEHMEGLVPEEVEEEVEENEEVGEDGEAMKGIET